MTLPRHPSGWPIGWHRPRRAHCAKGHALTGDGRDRQCSECRRQRDKARRDRIMADPRLAERHRAKRRDTYRRTRAKV